MFGYELRLGQGAGVELRLPEDASRICLLAPLGKFRPHFRGVGIFDLLVDSEGLFDMPDSLSTLSMLPATAPIKIIRANIPGINHS